MGADASTISGFFDPVAARECYRERRSGVKDSPVQHGDFGVEAVDPAIDRVCPIIVSVVAERLRDMDQAVAHYLRPTIITEEQDGGGLQPDLDKKAETAGKPVFEVGVIDHLSSLPVGVGASQGRARAEASKDASASPRPDAPLPPTTPTWSNPMRKLLAACRRLDDHWAGDLIGVVFLFCLIPAVLFFGPVLFGGR